MNFKGTFLCCKYAYPHLKASRGCIVNISSMTGVTGAQCHAVYSATKGAINASTQSMAVDYGREGIRCNAVCPSSVTTENYLRSIESDPKRVQQLEYRNQINCLGYTASPGEVASVVLFLASPAASFMTGAIVPVSAGTECGYGIKQTP